MGPLWSTPPSFLGLRLAEQPRAQGIGTCEGVVPAPAQNGRSRPDSTEQSQPEPWGGDAPSAPGGAAGWGGSAECSGYFQNNSVIRKEMTKGIGVLRGQSRASDQPLELTVAGVSVLERPRSVLFSGLALCEC